MITLNQNDSNLYWFIKGWYKENDFWKSLGIIYEEAYEHEPNIAGIYFFVQRLWVSYLKVAPNMEYLWDEYDVLSMPSSNWKIPGGTLDAFENPEFNDAGLLRARIGAMCSLLRHAESKYFSPLPIVAVGNLYPKK